MQTVKQARAERVIQSNRRGKSQTVKQTQEGSDCQTGTGRVRWLNKCGKDPDGLTGAERVRQSNRRRKGQDRQLF